MEYGITKHGSQENFRNSEPLSPPQIGMALTLPQAVFPSVACSSPGPSLREPAEPCDYEYLELGCFVSWRHFKNWMDFGSSQCLTITLKWWSHWVHHCHMISCLLMKINREWFSRTIFNAMVCHKTINIKTFGVPANFSLHIWGWWGLAALYLQVRIKLVIYTALDFASQVITLLMIGTCEVTVSVITRAKQCHCEQDFSK